MVITQEPAQPLATLHRVVATSFGDPTEQQDVGLPLPARSPNLNAYAERFVRTIKESCLERLILFGESSVRRAAAEFTVHYHRERNHQGLNNKLICPDLKSAPEGGEVKRRERLGGLLKYYYRTAA